ncbi:hypothetical protein JOQ06_022581 [Pogonophryne albipinna]|uniref:HECT domain-containing protein n=1 Tax=Pogonophryne albipinna TaxID=1090488 RepID=A0AAD6ABN5_9TELE|nr:hypothetical protein JOQ06_022581 [Pogonophryne albipinna]
MASVPPAGSMAGTSAQSGDRNSSVAAAAHTLITVITQHLSQGQPEGRKEDQTLPGPSVEQKMAGLGKRHTSMPLDVSHEEFFSLLKKEYPKLQALDGGWLLYKSTGGQGKRKLIMIPPDSDGYTGTLLRSVTGAGKNTLYIVPLQHEFDLTPLPADAECMEECLSSEEDIETTSEVEIVSVVHPVQNHTEKSLEEKVPCPICFESFTPQFLEIHASMCGERDQHVRLDEKTDMGHNNGKAMERQFESVDDVLDTISGRVDVEKRFNIQISRTNILERGLLQWQRQKGSSPTATLNVTFFGEAGVDTGALRKEFLTEVVDSDLYRTVGEILAVSLAQGGPAPAFFSPWTYSYLCSGRINQKVLNSDSVADVQLRELIDQVESATEHSMIGLSDEILNCGYTGNVSIPNKDTIVRAIILHAVLWLQPMLEQLREGLQLYGLLSLMSQYPDICQPLSMQFVMTSILLQLSDKGTTRHQVELEMMNFIQDFLYEAEDHGHVDKDGQHPITPATFLQWITGQGHVPLLPSEKKDFAVVIQFNHDCSADFGHHSVCYPVVTACAKTITLPVRHMRPYDKFKNILTEAFQLGQEFSNV